MTEPTPPPTAPQAARPPAAPPLQWLALLALSALFAGALELAKLPAALLIGPMAAGVILGVRGFTVRVPRPIFSSAQVVIGCLVASSVTPAIIGLVVGQWPVVFGVVLATLAASGFLGYLISRWKILPGTTAVWGSAPGASTAMVLMAGAFGADPRLVAFMQYLRVIMVSVGAAAVAALFIDTGGVARPPIDWFPALDWVELLLAIAVGAAGALAAKLARLPSPFFLGSFTAGVALSLAGLTDPHLPEWLLAIAYTAIGWSIGLNFTPAIVRSAARALPQVVGSILALMAFCGAMAWGLTRWLDVDPLTAYLATSPGGLDTVAIIGAASRSIDLSFVMAMQIARFLIVLAVGPFVARWIAKLVKP
ncbi:MAG: AbrB family transcriptional regulator [Rhizobiaceae bacterium]